MRNSARFSAFSVFIISFLLSLSPALAEKIKVRKVKGNNAIVESSLPLEEGQTYELLTEPISDEVDFKSGVVKSRSNALSFGAKFGYLKSDTTETTSFSLQTRYGWNFSTIEIGLLAEADSIDTGAGATTTYLGGGYFDYNLVANRDPRQLIYGAFVLAGFGSTKVPSGSANNKIEANAGAFISYFISDTTTALRTELFGVYQQQNTSTANVNITGVGSRLLLAFYF